MFETIKTVLAVTSLIVLSACSSPEEAKEAAAPAPPADPTSRQTLYEAGETGAIPFVTALYAAYAAGGIAGPKPAAGQEPLYSRIFNAVLGTDVRVGGAGGPRLDRDPICQCTMVTDFQTGPIAVIVDPAKATAATAHVAFTNDGKATSQTLKLLKEGPMWRVEDVIDADGKSLSADLLKVIEARGG